MDVMNLRSAVVKVGSWSRSAVSSDARYRLCACVRVSGSWKDFVAGSGNDGEDVGPRLSGHWLVLIEAMKLLFTDRRVISDTSHR